MACGQSGRGGGFSRRRGLLLYVVVHQLRAWVLHRSNEAVGAAEARQDGYVTRVLLVELEGSGGLARGGRPVQSGQQVHRRQGAQPLEHRRQQRELRVPKPVERAVVLVRLPTQGGSHRTLGESEQARAAGQSTARAPLCAYAEVAGAQGNDVRVDLRDDVLCGVEELREPTRV